MFMRYNTPAYRKLYKQQVARYTECDKIECIEPRVRKICEYVHAANLVVSIWSCEGHEDPYHQNAGYIMLMCRNREASVILTDVFHRVSGYMFEIFDYEATITIEHDLSTIDSYTGIPCAYPALVIRNQHGMSDGRADLWWLTVTECVAKLLESRIQLQNDLKESKHG